MPASVGQRLLWLMDHYRGAGGGLTEPLVWRLRGPLDLAALRRGLDLLSARHEALRTTYALRRSRLTQLIHEPRPVRLEIVDLRGAAAPEQRLTAEVEAELSRGVDPTHWPLRALLWQLADDDHLLCVNLHHLAVDYRSNRIITEDLTRLYNAQFGTEPELPPVRRQYADWSAGQARALRGSALRELTGYWTATLDGARFLPVRPAAGDAGVRMDEPREAHIQGARLANLRAVARERGLPMLPVALAVFFASVHRLTGMTDLTIGTLVDVRGAPEYADTVGFFENLVLVRVQAGDTFAETVQRCGVAVAGALAHAALPFHMLPPATTGAAREAGGGRADDVVVNLIDAWDARLGLDRLDAQLMPLGFGHSSGRFGVRVVMMEYSEGLVISVTHGLDGPAPSWVDGLLPAIEELLAEPLTAAAVLP